MKDSLSVKKGTISVVLATRKGEAWFFPLEMGTFHHDFPPMNRRDTLY